MDTSQHRALTTDFAEACNHGDLESLVATLDPEVVGWFDSGGRLPGAPRQPVTGARRVATLLLASFAGHAAVFGVATFNGEPGVFVKVEDTIVTVIALDTADGLVMRILAIGNPDKLGHLR